MQASGVSIRPATGKDAANLSAFAERVFFDTFAMDNTPEDIELYRQSTFSTELQAREIAAPGALVLLACADANRLAGYAHLIPAEIPSCVADIEALEVRRFYVAHEWHGSGLAKSLMQEVVQHARTRGARTLWLGVWERNGRAIAFYRKFGFREVGSHPFLLGHDVQTDLVMAASL